MVLDGIGAASPSRIVDLSLHNLTALHSDTDASSSPVSTFRMSLHSPEYEIYCDLCCQASDSTYPGLRPIQLVEDAHRLSVSKHRGLRPAVVEAADRNLFFMATVEVHGLLLRVYVPLRAGISEVLQPVASNYRSCAGL